MSGSMRPYPKIETLFDRDENFKVDPNRIRKPVFRDIARWVVTEKIDGMNMRVAYTKGEDAIQVAGRSDNAQIPGDLLGLIQMTFTPEKMDGLLFNDAMPGTRVTLYGEGYGAGIQKGAAYLATKGFILFDVLIEVDGKEFWQSDQVVTDFAARLEIKRAPILGVFTLSEIIEMVRGGLKSVEAISPRMAEGIVARTVEPLFDARGGRLILKLKGVDF